MQINNICFSPKSYVKTENKIQPAKKNSGELAANIVSYKGKLNFEQAVNSEILRLLHIIVSKVPLPNEGIKKPFLNRKTGVIDLIDVISTALSFINEGKLEKFDVFRPLKITAEADNFSDKVCLDILIFLKGYLKHEDKIIRDNAENCFMKVAINSGKELTEVLNIINAQMSQNGSTSLGTANIRSLLKNADKYGKINLPEIYNKTWDILQAGLEKRNKHEKALIYGILNEHPLNYCTWGFWLM